MAKISVSNHAVERYRERMTEDSVRKDRDSSVIRKMITDAIIAAEGWPQLEELMSCGTQKEYELWISIHSGWDFLGKHKAVLSPTKKKKNYTVVTFV